MDTHPILLTAKEAAIALRVSPRKLWEMTHRGDIPYVKLDRCLRYPLRDLEAWIASKTSAGGVSIYSPSVPKMNDGTREQTSHTVGANAH